MILRKNTKWQMGQRIYLCPKVIFTIRTDCFIIQLTGGDLIIRDIKTSAIINQIKGYNYLYTGDVKPDEKELFALEKGKRFYIVSLEDFKQKMSITLPRSYEAIDVYGSYSEDGKILYVPVYKYFDEDYMTLTALSRPMLSACVCWLKKIFRNKQQVLYWDSDEALARKKYVDINRICDTMKVW